MSPEQWNKVLDLFHAACEKTGGERVALLDAASSRDPSLRVLVEQMLRDHEGSDSLLNESLHHLLAPVHVPPSLPAPAKRFGRYELIAPIGRGGMGEVWVAHDTELERRVALKFLNEEAAFGRAVEHLSREAKTVSALNHPNIVTVHEVIRNEQAPVIVMELVDGKSLRDLCGTPLPFNQLVGIGLQVARALVAAHAHGIIHRDIKPENILLRSDGYVKVVDFSLARRVSTGAHPVANELAGAALVAGTLRYMSPEQARGELVAWASDIFSFGLVLYELAAGRHAFPRESAGDALRAILTEHAPQPSSANPLVPPRLDSLVVDMLAREPALRPSAEDVARKLEEMQTRAGVPEARAAASARIRASWIAASLLILLACILFTWFWKRRSAATKQPAFYQVTTLVPENRATAAAISPDGKSAAYANVDGIFLRTMRNGETRRLGGPADFAVDRIAWFRDASKLVVSGFSERTHVPAVWIISAGGEPPRLLRTMARQGCPSPDGTRIAFTPGDRSAIWLIGLNGENPREILAGNPGDTFPVVFWSAWPLRIAFERRHYSPKLDRPNRSLQRYYQQDYESLALDTGTIVARVPDLWIGSATVLPDSRMLFLKWDSPGSDGSAQLWEVKTDVRTGSFLNAPRRIPVSIDTTETELTDMTATADGSTVLVLKAFSQQAVFVGDFNPSLPRITGIHRLTLDERTSYPHAWTSDSRGVIFESNRNGNFDLFKQYIDQRTPETIVASPMTEMLPQLAPDGRSVLYEARPQQMGSEGYNLMRVPVSGGTPQRVPIGGRLDEFRCALGPGKRCVLRTTVRGQYYIYYDLQPVSGKGRELARTAWIPGILGDWDVSPDGKYVALPNHDPHDARIRVLALDPGPGEAREHEVVLPGLAYIHGLVWAADPRAWYVSVDTTVGHRLLYVGLDGRFQSLGDIQGWAVPSPNGRRVAFLDRIIATNAWAIDRR